MVFWEDTQVLVHHRRDQLLPPVKVGDQPRAHGVLRRARGAAAQRRRADDIVQVGERAEPAACAAAAADAPGRSVVPQHRWLHQRGVGGAGQPGLHVPGPAVQHDRRAAVRVAAAHRRCPRAAPATPTLQWCPGAGKILPGCAKSCGLCKVIKRACGVALDVPRALCGRALQPWQSAWGAANCSREASWGSNGNGTAECRTASSAQGQHLCIACLGPWWSSYHAGSRGA